MRSLDMTRTDVIAIIENPDAETPTHKGRTNAWRKLNDNSWIRVPYITEDGVIVVISVHPRKRGPSGQ